MCAKLGAGVGIFVLSVRESKPQPQETFHGSRNTSSTVCHDVNSCLLWMEFNLESLECVYNTILYLSIYCMAGNFLGGGEGSMCMDYLLHESYLPSVKLVKSLLLCSNIVYKSLVFVCLNFYISWQLTTPCCKCYHPLFCGEIQIPMTECRYLSTE